MYEVKNTCLSVNTGLDEPGPGSFVFHRRFWLSLHSIGMVVSLLTPVPLGPRKRDHSLEDSILLADSEVFADAMNSPVLFACLFSLGISSATAVGEGTAVGESGDWLSGRCECVIARPVPCLVGTRIAKNEPTSTNPRISVAIISLPSVSFILLLSLLFKLQLVLWSASIRLDFGVDLEQSEHHMASASRSG